MREQSGTIINYLAISTILIGAAGVIGWLLHIPVLYTYLSNGASMKFITALSTLLIGGVLLSMRHKKAVVTQLLSWAVLLIGVATVAEYLFEINLQVDVVFTGSNTSLPGEAPGRMSLYTAILFILVSGGALLLIFKRFFAGQCIILLGMLFTYSAILGLLFNIVHLFVFGSFSAISFPTATGLLATSFGLLLYSADSGWMPEVFIRHSAAQTVRYAIRYFFITTPLFVGLFLLALRYTQLPPEVTLVMLIIGVTVCTLPLAFKLLKKMNQADKNRYRLARALEKRTQELAYKNEALSRINNDLDNIMHVISHDLKTPLTSLQASLDILEMSLDGTADERVHQLIAVPKRSVRQLKDMINYLGQTLKAQRPNQELLEEIDVRALLEEMKTTDLQDAIQNTGAIVRVHSDNCLLLYERIHMRSILQNLVSNALKYHHPNRLPVVNIHSRKVEGGVQVTVEDNGLGIPEKEMQHLFSRYKRFHKHVEGTGIGLYLTKRLLEARGGRIEVTSKEGEGTTFKVFFPFVKKEVTAPQQK